MNTPNFELLKDAYAIVEGIPAPNFNLQTWIRGDHTMPGCGTIACAAGWLCMHPKFKELGLNYEYVQEKAGMHPTFAGMSHYEALAALFSISNDDATALFTVTDWEDRHSPGASHKGIFLKRVRDFLRLHGQLKEQLEAAVPA